MADNRIVTALCAVGIWGTMAPLIKALGLGFPTFETLFISGLFATGFLAVNLELGRKKKMEERKVGGKEGEEGKEEIEEKENLTFRDYAVMVGLGFLGLFAYSGLYYAGLGILSTQEACILNYLWPLMLVLFSCLILKEPFTIRTFLAMAASFVGVIVLVSGSGGGSTGAPLGIAFCITAATFYGLFCVLNKRTGYDQDLAMMVMWGTVAVCSLPVGLLTEAWRLPTFTEVLALAYLGMATDGLAYLLWAKALEGGESAGVANLAYLVPFLSTFLSALLLHEPIKATAIVALCLIVGGILLQNLGGKRKAAGEGA